MSTPRLSREAALHAAELVTHYGSIAAAARATGIPCNTLKSRILAGQTYANCQQTMIPMAQPEQPRLAKIADTKSDLKHFIIPDPQCKPGVPLDHMRWAGLYACVKRPTSIIDLGDHYDMPSLCSYDKGKRSAENARYYLDIEAGNKGLDLFMEPIYEEVERSLNTDTPWQPSLHFTRGNHEYRIERYTEDQPAMADTLGYDSFNFDAHGWVSYPFLDVVVLDGVAYSHYFVSGVMGRSVTTARALLTKKHQSCVMGHVQRYESAMDYNAEGKRITGLFAGCYYQHEDNYRDAQSNIATWRGVHVLYGVHDGEFTHNSISLSYLKDRFGK